MTMEQVHFGVGLILITANLLTAVVTVTRPIFTNRLLNAAVGGMALFAAATVAWTMV